MVEEYDDILLDGERVQAREKIYIALNKPVWNNLHSS